MISHEKATLLAAKLTPLESKMHYPPQNLVDLAWKDKAPKSREPLFRQPIEFTGMSPVFADILFHFMNGFARARSVVQTPQTARLDKRAATVCSCVFKGASDRGSDACRDSDI
jgi:hypothetical protein